MFKILKIDHIGIAVKDLKEAVKFYCDVLGMTISGKELIEQQNVEVCFIPCGESELELMESTSPEGPIAKFIEKNGEGIHHFAARVDNIDAACRELKTKGVRLVDEIPRAGSCGARIAFIHPKAAGGILLELYERKNHI